MVKKKELKHEIAVLTSKLRVAEIHVENANRETMYAERRGSQLRRQLINLGKEPVT